MRPWSRAPGLARIVGKLLFLAALGTAGAGPASALTVTRVSAPVLYIDPGDSLYAAYAAYRIVNNGGIGYSDLWVEAGSFAGPVISLAPNETGLVRVGALAPGDTTYAYFYIEATGIAAVAENHTIRVFEGEPPSGTLLASSVFTLTAEATIAANANKVTTVVSGPNPPGLGGILTVTVTGETGTIGSPPSFSMTPSGYRNWPAYALQLTDVVMTMAGSANAGTYSHALYFLLPSTANTTYTIVYTFRVTGLTAQPTLFYPVQYIASGTQVKHTGNIDVFSIPPILPANNHLTLAKSAAPPALTDADTVTYTVTLTNASSTLDLSVEDIRDRLPSSPGSAAYVPGSAKYQSVTVADPWVTGQDLLFVGPFAVAASGTGVLTYRVLIPSAVGGYANEVIARVGSIQIDRTLNPADDDPAIANVLVGPAEIGLAKRVLSGPVNNGNGTYGLTFALVVENSGVWPLDSVQVVDDLSAAFGGATGWSVNSVAVTSGSLTLNPGYTGDPPNAQLLTGQDGLGAGATAEIHIAVTVNPGANLGPYANSASARGVGLAGFVTTDISANGSIPDADGNGDPANDSAATPVGFAEAPELGVAKRILSGPVNNGDGTYAVTYAFVLQNSGDVEIRNLRLADNLLGTFAGTSSFSVSGLSVLSGSLTLNPAYSGVAPNTGLLAGTDILPAGATASLQFTVTVTPGPALGPHANSAVATGTSPAGTSLADLSANGSIPDANGNGNPGDDSATTGVTFSESPELGAAKRVLAGPVNNGDGTYSLTYAFVLQNSGDIEIRNLQLTDNLAATFAGAASFSVDNVTVTGGSLTLNPAFTGSAPNTGLLTGTDELPAGSTATLTLAVTVTPGAALGPYANSATAAGTSPAGTALSDLTANGAVPDANGNGNPGDDSGSTSVTFTESPRIGAAKEIQSGPIPHGDGTYTLTYSCLAENSGDVTLSSVQIDEDLNATFSGALGFVVDNISVASGPLTTNPGFTGVTPNTNLLSGTDALAPGTTGRVLLTVTVTPGANLGPYDNHSTARGTSPAGSIASDLSVNGSVPDANGNGNPADDNAATPVTFLESPELGAAKRVISGPVNNGDGTATLTYSLLVQNSGDVEIRNLQLVDDLAAAFAGAVGFSVDGVAVSGGSLTPNPAFTGSAPNTALLAGTDVLPAGQIAVLDVTVTVDTGPNLGPYGNLFSASGSSPAGQSLLDLSVAGIVPDANGNGDPGDDSGATLVNFSEHPRIGLAKRVLSGPVNNGDGTYTVTFRFEMENSGDVPLSGISLTEDLFSVFAGVTAFSVDAWNVVSGPLTTNPGFTGFAPNTNLLSGSDVLAVGQGATVDLTVTLTPGSALGPFGNTASAAGTSPGGGLATDLSTDGSVPDANGNGDPGDDSATTVVSMSENPALTVTKQLLSAPTSNGDGTYTLGYGISVQNTGDVEIRNLQLTDDLAAALPGVTAFTVASVAVTGGSLTPNPSFTGSAPDTVLLAGSDELAAGATATLTLTLSVTPGPSLGPFVNHLGATGTSPAGAVLSDRGTSTPATFTESPELGAAKRVLAGPVNNGDGTYSLTYAFVLQNSGDIEIRNLQLTEGLDITFGSAASFSVDNVTVTGGSLTLNPAFTGSAPTTALLTGTDELPAGSSATLTLTVTVTPGSTLGPYTNSALASGTSPAGTVLGDVTADGSVPDANGNGNPGDDSGSTPVSFTEAPEIGLAKRISSGPASNGDGSFAVTFEFRVENSGDVPLSGLQITDDLASAFAGADAFQVDAVSVASGSLTPNPAYTGTAPEDGLLAGFDTLAPGSSAVLALTVTVIPGLDLGPYANTSVASATSPAGAHQSDASTQGAVPDANGNGDPGDDSVVTSVTFAGSPELGLAKAVGSGPTSNGDGTFGLTYDLLIRNSGDIVLSGLQLSDDLALAFAGAASFHVDAVAVTGGSLSVNPAFTGTAPDTNLLAGTDLLNPGSAATLRITLTVTPGAQLGPYANSAYGTGTAAGGGAVADRSTDGTEPDADGDGDPTDDSVATSVNFFESPELGAAKAVVSGPVPQGDGSQTLTYSITVRNSGDVQLANLQIGENLAAAFAGALGFAVQSISVTSGALTPNPGFTGAAPDTNLLTGADTLAPGATAVVALTLAVNPGAFAGPYANQAWVSGRSPAGALVSDASTSGIDPDPDGNGDPGNDAAPTLVTFVLSPTTLLVEKSADRTEAVTGDFVGYRVLISNPGLIPVVGAVLRDLIPAGFAYLSGTGRILRAGTDGVFDTPDDAAADLEPSGSRPLEFAGLALAPGESLRLSYRLRVGAGVVAGEYRNEATPMLDGGAIGNTAFASVRIGSDPLFDQTTLLGKVWNDRDGDGWQDPTLATGVVIRGGFPRSVYRVGSTHLDLGGAPRLIIDRGATPALLAGIAIEELPGREHALQGSHSSRAVIELVLEEPVFDDLWITTAEGTRLHMDAAGHVTSSHEGAKAKGLTGQDLQITRRVEISAEGTRVTYTLTNQGLEESGIPGARVVTPEGFLLETDADGRFHLAGVDGGRWERGANVLFKVDPASLPAGSTFTTENPRLLRITPSLMDKVNFGVRLPDAEPTLSAVQADSARTQAIASGIDSSAASPAAETLPGGGAVWATVDPDGIDPRLEIGAPAVALLSAGENAGPGEGVLRFTLYTNYAAFLERWEIGLYRGDDPLLTRPVRTLAGTDLRFSDKVVWDGVTESGRVQAGDEYLYVLRVFDHLGNMDQTAAKSVRFVTADKDGLRKTPLAQGESLPLEGGEVWGGTGLLLRNIPVEGATVRIHGSGGSPETEIRVAGERVPRSSDGSFAVETLLPAGTHALPVTSTDSTGGTWARELRVDVPEDRFFLVGMADVTAGHNEVSGHVEALSPDDHFDGDVFVDGRVALYLKGKVRGKYLMTAHLDTGEEGLNHLLDNMQDKDPRTFLRHLDPDRYYPVYGDESTTLEDAQSQGKLYARMEWDRSSFVWGNYQTGLTGSEFAQYNRSLYGAKLSHRSRESDAFGSPQTELTAFASEQQTVMGHDEFRGTGGSLYYLGHTDVVEGSEKAWVEVRERDSQRVLENTALVRGRDYEIDEIQGRLILTRPLTSVTDGIGPSIIRDEPLDGDDVMILVDYEYTPQGFQAGNMTYGMRAKAQAGNHLGLGGSFAHENRDAMDYELRGLDGSLRAGKGTYLKAEVAQSEARQSTVGGFSDDGGLTFQAVPGAVPDSTSGGGAVGVEGRLDVGELTGGKTDVSASGWWKRREAGFNTARLETAVDRIEAGGEFLARLSERFSLSGRAATLEEKGIREDLRAGLQADLRAGDRWTVSAEGRRTQDRPDSGPDQDATLGGLRLGYDLTSMIEVYGAGQGTFERSDAYAKNDLGTLGLHARIKDLLSVRAEGSAGDRGDAARLDLGLALSQRFRLDLDNTVGSLDPKSRASADWRLSESHEVYGTYTLSPDRSEGRRGVFTLGQRKSLSDQLRIFTENQFSRSEERSGLATVFGLDFRPGNRWTLGLSVERSRLEEAQAGDVDRDAISLSAGLAQGKTRASSKLEFRRDRGAARRTQWLTANRVDHPVSEDLRFTGKLSLSLTEDELDDKGDARFVESGVGLAYRPIGSDRWQVLGKYSFLLDLPSLGQVPIREDERMHVVSTETLFDLTRRIGLGGKIAGRWSGARADRNSGAWYPSHTYLWVARGRYHVMRGWDGIAEYRWLRALDGDNTRQGVLLGLNRSLTENLQAGAGFNFTEFSDDLTDLGYRNRGVFVNLVGTY